MQKKIIYIILILTFIVGFASAAHAGMGSDSYRIPTSVLSGGGTPMSSDSYQTDATLGQSSPLMDVDNPPISTSYELYSGFWYTIEAAVVSDNPILSLGDECGISGGCMDVSLSLVNVSGVEVASITCDIGYDSNDLLPLDCLLGPAGEAAEKDISICDSTSPGIFKVGINTSGDVIGDGIVAYADFEVFAGCGLQTDLTLNCTVQNPQGGDVPVTSEGGSLEVARVSDLDCNGQVAINEVIKVIRMYLGQDTVETIADPNCDGSVAINEVIKAINCYLETEACPCS